MKCRAYSIAKGTGIEGCHAFPLPTLCAAPPMIRFVFSHPRLLAFGVLMTLFSSFGQTFLISIFVPRILDAFGLSTAAFGMLYAGATLTSAFTLPFFGRLMDRIPLHVFSLAAGGGLAISCFAMAVSWNVPSLFLSIVGLRLTGQGLLGLTASTTMAREFGSGRGKALSVSAMGYPLGEGLLPMLVVILIHAVGWRFGWSVLGCVILATLLPATHVLVRNHGENRCASTSASGRVRRSAALKDPMFYLLLPVNIYLPLVLTALFLYQIPLAEERGWKPETMAAAFIGFAAARLLVSMIIGPVIDRFSATRIFPLFLLPSLVGLALLGTGHAVWIPFAYLFLVGVSQGMAGPMMTAVWAETYGVESLGATKGTVATFGVLATALGPLVFGFLLDAGCNFHQLVLGSVAGALVVVVVAWIARSRLLARKSSRQKILNAN